ncbi:MAG: hypothetical protein BWY23_00018 [Spirochaetes bacterium ADurb.Bin218]|jgi:hypothetical protein|nr:hypothetical protein [Spirochaetota bacterium]OQB00454.1 MAG: hypothetical protein BWY23_00018 [Spirochaetes bacterium ADurb.Bin218]HOV09789.1 hypothetical protein [Spirochaetota bacterium]
MKKKLVVAILLLWANALFADQAAWISKDKAEMAVALLKNIKEVRHFCAPCGDNFYKVEVVSSVQSQKATSEGNFYVVKLNGSEIDLAYVYIPSGNRWINLAIALNIKVEDVPKYLPEDLRNEEVSPADLPYDDDNENIIIPDEEEDNLLEEK